MDKLAKLMYMNQELVYMYKGVVDSPLDTPCLGMVDDILSIQKCSSQTVNNNAIINSFIEYKKLTFSKKNSKEFMWGNLANVNKMSTT